MLLQTSVEAARVAADAARDTATVALIGTALTLIVSLLLGYLNNSASGRTQHQLQELKQSSEQGLAFLNSRLRTDEANQNARRDYEYEARKRLYKECEPLLFRLSEASENALHRIYSLARTARDGHLGPSGWLSGPGYYLTSTLYNLLVPCAVFRLLQERLTFVDLEVDRRIRDQYLLAKWVAISFTDDFSLAKTEPVLAYDPHGSSPAQRMADPARYCNQGVPLGRLDAAIDALIETDAQGVSRVLTYGKFEIALAADLASNSSRYGIFADGLKDFHPQTHPVLWRILVVQALLHHELIRMFRKRDQPIRPIDQMAVVSPDEFDRLFWSPTRDKKSEAVAQEPFTAAAAYFQAHLPVLFDELREPAPASA
jgi:hypothetical protein